MTSTHMSKILISTTMDISLQIAIVSARETSSFEFWTFVFVLKDKLSSYLRLILKCLKLLFFFKIDLILHF